MLSDLIKNRLCLLDLTFLAEGVHQHVERCHSGWESGSKNLGVESPGGSRGLGLEEVVEEARARVERQRKGVPAGEAETLDGVGDVANVGVLDGKGADEGGLERGGGDGLESSGEEGGSRVVAAAGDEKAEEGEGRGWEAMPEEEGGHGEVGEGGMTKGGAGGEPVEEVKQGRRWEGEGIEGK